MEKKTKNRIKQIIFILLGGGLMWYVIQKMDPEKFWEDAKSMNYWFFLISGMFAMTSHYFRALRWKQLIQTLGYEPKTKNIFASVLFMYASNIAFPRSGEVARCGTIYQYEDIPIPKLLGTVVIERLVDLISLVIITFLLLFLQYDLVLTLVNNSSIPELTDKVLNNKLLLTSILAIVGFLFLVFLKFRKRIFSWGPLKKIGTIYNDMTESLKSIFAVKNKLLFLLYSIVIWAGYIGMFYVCFFAFEPTSHLDFAAGMAAFVAGSIGMVFPAPGGAGTWHVLVILALTTLGVSESDSTSWANVAFGIMTITVGIAGIVSYFLLPYLNKDKKDSIATDA